MPDIAMCRDSDCPQRAVCYRYRAVPSEFSQSFFMSSPRESGGCPAYVEIWPTQTRLVPVEEVDANVLASRKDGNST